MSYHQIPAEHISEAIITYTEGQKTWKEEVNAWIKSQGAVGDVSRGYAGIHNYELSGLIFNETPDLKIWKQSNEDDRWYYPRRNTKVGKVIVADMEALNKKKPSIAPIFKIANLKMNGYWKNYKIYSPGYFIAFDNSFVFEIHDEAGYEPPEYAVELKASQFHKLLEDTQEASRR